MTTDRNVIEPKNDGFIITPRYVKAMCDSPYEVDLWLTIKDISGDTGECYLSTEELATLSDMSVGKVSSTRQSLIDKGLINGSFHKDPGYPQPVWHLSIPDDIWVKNAEFNKKYKGIKEKVALKLKSLHVVKAKEPSCGEKGVSPHEKGVSPHETKKILKEDLKVGGNAGASIAPLLPDSRKNALLERKALELGQTPPAAPNAGNKKGKVPANNAVATKAKNFPAVMMYFRIIGRYPMMINFGTVVDAVQAVSLRLGRPVCDDDLKPFAEAWGAKYGKSLYVNLAWLTDWAVKGEIPGHVMPVSKSKSSSPFTEIEARSVR